MTKTINIENTAKNNLEELSVKQLKEMIKDNAETSGSNLPIGMWKMTKEQLITEVEDIYTDFIDKDNESEDEFKMEEEKLVEVEEKNEAVAENEKVDKKPEEKRGKRKKVMWVEDENGHQVIEGIGNFSNYVTETHNVAYGRIRGVLIEDENAIKWWEEHHPTVKFGFVGDHKFGASNQYKKVK